MHGPVTGFFADGFCGGGPGDRVFSAGIGGAARPPDPFRMEFVWRPGQPGLFRRLWRSGPAAGSFTKVF